MRMYWPFTVMSSVIVGCANPEERYDVGYSDGYASGYNTTCKIRMTLIEGDFGNEHYERGYNEGYSAGSAACLAEKHKRA